MVLFSILRQGSAFIIRNSHFLSFGFQALVANLEMEILELRVQFFILPFLFVRISCWFAFYQREAVVQVLIHLKITNDQSFFGALKPNELSKSTNNL